MKKNRTAKTILVMIAAFVLTCGLFTAAENLYVMADTVAEPLKEKEDNDTFIKANNLVANSTIVGSLNQKDGVDYYRFVAPENGRLDVTFLHDTKDIDANWGVSLYTYVDGEYSTLSYGDANYGDRESLKLPFVGAVASREYYIEVTRKSDGIDGVEYRIELSFKESFDYEMELNDSFLTATYADDFTTIYGTMTNSDVLDYYKFVAPEDGKIQFSFDHAVKEDRAAWDVELYMYDGGRYKKLVSATVHCNDREKKMFPLIGAVEGKEYYVKVFRRSTGVAGVRYSLSTDFYYGKYFEKEGNDSFIKATTIDLRHTFVGTTDSSKDYDYYKIVATKKGKLEFYFDYKAREHSGAWEVDLYTYKNGGYDCLEEKTIYIKDAIKTPICIDSVSVKKDEEYYVKISTKIGDMVGETYKLRCMIPPKPLGDITVRRGKTSAKLSWAKRTYATTYTVQMYKKDGYKTIAKTDKTSLVVRKLKENKHYKFRIRYSYLVCGHKMNSPWKMVANT